MDNFDYQRATSVADAVARLQSAPNARLLAGGQSLLPLVRHGNARVGTLIDIGHLPELGGIRETGDDVIVGAGVTHAQLAASALVQSRLPGLAALAGAVGDPHVRHLGTVGGAVAWNGVGADYPAAVLGLAATVETNLRAIPAERFVGNLEVEEGLRGSDTGGVAAAALKPGEVITAIRFATPLASTYEKFPIPASRSALVGVFVARFVDHVRVAVTGAAASAFRLVTFEKALAESFDPASLLGLEVDAARLLDDLHGGADYRAHLVGVLARRAVARCQNGGG